jgi:aquaporin Z
MSVQQPDPADSVFGAPSDEYAGADEDAALVVDEPETTGPGLLARTGAELFGTFVLVFAGVGVMLYAKLDSTVGSLSVAAAFGIAAAVAMVTVGRVSGGHFNPAISLGAAIGGRLSWADLLPYWLAQLVGGALGAAILFLTIPTGLASLLGASEDKRELFGTTANGFGAHSPLAHLLATNNIQSQAQFSLAAALLIEVIATGILVAVYLVLSRRTPAAQAESRSPFVVGMTLAALVLVALPITNAGLNPARSTASAILSPSWALAQLWLFWVAPLLGAALAALLVRAFGSTGTASSDEAEEAEEYEEGEQGDEGEEWGHGETLPVVPA